MLELIAALAVQSESAMKTMSDVVDTNVIVDLSRQYRAMQMELTDKVKKLEEEVSQLKEELGTNIQMFNDCSFVNKEVSLLTMVAYRCIFVCLVLCQEELKKEKRIHEQAEQEKDATIADLQHKLDSMETDYEKILHVSCNGGRFSLKLIQSDLKEALMKQPITGLWRFDQISLRPGAL